MFKKILVLLLGIGLIIFGTLTLRKNKAVEESGYLKFLNGNSLVKENKNKEALEEYKLAMDTNEDINIKKNFEIIKNKIEEEQNQENNDNQQQENQNKNDLQDDKQQNDQQNNDKNNENKKDNQQNNQEQKDNKNENDSSDNQQPKEQKNNEQNSNEQNKETTPKELTQEEKALKQKEEELRSIMQRLEGNEKQAFKNNERVLNTSENKNSENRW